METMAAVSGGRQGLRTIRACVESPSSGDSSSSTCSPPGKDLFCPSRTGSPKS